MKIALGSDIHLEFGYYDISPQKPADVLVLAGDIMIAEDLYDHSVESIEKTESLGLPLGARQEQARLFRKFLGDASARFNQVIMIAGNHEFYHGKWYATLDYMKAECARYPNVYFLENSTVEIDNVLFVGATLWTDMNNNDWFTLYDAKQQMSDFKRIRNDKQNYQLVRPEDTVSRHIESLDYIVNTIKTNADKKIVVVSHHAPSELSVADQFKGQRLNGAYRSRLEEMILDHPQIRYWFHGHMHDATEYQLGDTTVVCNPRGYLNHDPGADKYMLKYIEV